MVPQEAESRALKPAAEPTERNLPEQSTPGESWAQRMAPMEHQVSLRLRANQLVADSSADALEAA
jgi:hypothetical protein